MLARAWAPFHFFFLMLNFAASGRATPHSESLLRDVAYSRVAGINLLLDASLPSSSDPTPAVIIVHGGGWVRGDRRVDVQPLFQPLTDAHIAWFSISYRLATDITQFGVAVDDVQQSVRFVRSHAAEYGVDPSRIALIGESAGGQLAAMAALRATPDASVKAVVALYTPTDLVSLFRHSNFIPPQIRDGVRGTPLENFVLAGLSQLSPIENIRPDMPPFLLIHGTADPLVPFAQSTRMCGRMKQIGANCEIYAVEGAGHGLRWWETARPSTGYKRKMIEWLERELGSSSSETSTSEIPRKHVPHRAE